MNIVFAWCACVVHSKMSSDTPCLYMTLLGERSKPHIDEFGEKKICIHVHIDTIVPLNLMSLYHFHESCTSTFNEL